MRRMLIVPLLGSAMAVWLPHAIARETVVLPGVVSPTGEANGVDTTGPGTLTIGNQNINTANDAGGGITTSAANTANIVFTGSSTVTGLTGTTGSTFLNIAAGANASTVTFSGPVFSTTFSVSGTGTVNFNDDFTSNTGSTMDFAGDGFINVAAGQTVLAAITNTAGAQTGTLTLGANSILDGAVGAASGLKQINVVGGNALITGQANAGAFSLGTNTLNVAGALAIPVAGVINTTIFSETLYGKIVPVGFATIGNALQVNVTITGPIPNGSIFDIVDATSGTSGSAVAVTSNTASYAFSATPTANGDVQITTTQIPLAVVIAPVLPPGAPVVPPVVPLVIAPVVDALPVTPATAPLLTPIALLPSPEAVAIALAQLGPGASGFGSPQEIFRVSQRFQDSWSAQLQGMQEWCRPDRSDDRYGVEFRDDSGCQPEDLRSHWRFSGFGTVADQRTAGGFEGHESNSLGAMLAYDTPLNAVTHMGVGFGYARSALDSKLFNSQADVDSYQAMAYLGYAPGPWFVNATAASGWDEYSSSRRVVFPGFDGSAEADYDGNHFAASGTAGYRLYFNDGQTILTPTATVQYTRLRVDSFTESGDPSISLSVAAQDYNLFQAGLGARLAHYFIRNDRQAFRAEFHANVLHSLDEDETENTAAFTAGGPAFTIRGLKPGEDIYNVGAGLTLINNKVWSIEGIYDVRGQANGYFSYQAMLNFVLRV